MIFSGGLRLKALIEWQDSLTGLIMKKCLIVIMVLILLSGACSKSEVLSECETVTDSSITLPDIIKPRSLQSISYLNGRIVTLTFTKEASHMTIFDSDGKQFRSVSLSGGIVDCRLIANGNKVVLNGIISEGNHIVQIYDIDKDSIIVSFSTRFYTYSSPNGLYYYSTYFFGIVDRPTIYDSTGNVIGNIDHSISVWNMHAIDDSTLIFAEGYIVKIIRIPEFDVIEQYVFPEVKKAFFEIGLSSNPDGSVFAIYNTDSVVVFDRTSQTKSVFPNLRPGVWGIENIIITDNGDYVLTLIHSPIGNKPSYNLYKKSLNGYIELARLEPFPEGFHLSSFYYLRGSQVYLPDIKYYPKDGGIFEEYSTIIVQLPNNSLRTGYMVKSDGISYPISNNNPDFLNVIFNKGQEVSGVLEYKHATFKSINNY
nr:hypothetical protein [candidate division Zixibacteria bacterium]